MKPKEIINQLKHIQKLIDEKEFNQEGQHDDSGFYETGTFIKSKIVKSKITKLINDISKSETFNNKDQRGTSQEEANECAEIAKACG